MSGVTKEKLEQIFKVYEDRKNNNPNTIRTSEVGTQTFKVAKLIRSARLFPTEEEIAELEKKVDPSKLGFFNMQRFVDVGL